MLQTQSESVRTRQVKQTVRSVSSGEAHDEMLQSVMEELSYDFDSLIEIYNQLMPSGEEAVINADDDDVIDFVSETDENEELLPEIQ